MIESINVCVCVVQEDLIRAEAAAEALKAYSMGQTAALRSLR